MFLRVYFECEIIAGETNKSAFWDSKTRGANGGQKGDLLWDLDAVSHYFTDGRFNFRSNDSIEYRKPFHLPLHQPILNVKLVSES